MENRNTLLYWETRYSQIWRASPTYRGNHRVTKQLRELESDGFIHRHDFKEVPPKVEYTLTELGESFMRVLDVIKDWGDLNLNKGKT